MCDVWCVRVGVCRQVLHSTTKTTKYNHETTRRLPPTRRPSTSRCRRRLAARAAVSARPHPPIPLPCSRRPWSKAVLLARARSSPALPPFLPASRQPRVVAGRNAQRGQPRWLSVFSAFFVCHLKNVTVCHFFCARRAHSSRTVAHAKPHLFHRAGVHGISPLLLKSPWR